MKGNQPIEMAELLELLREVFDRFRTLEHLPADTNLHRDLGLDSLDFVRLQVAIEDHFGVRFDPVHDDLAQAFETAGLLLALVHDLVKRNLK